jgi:hypothetical protein
MRKSLILLAALLVAVGGCKSARTKQIEDVRMVRVRLEQVNNPAELEAEISSLIERMQLYGETIYKDELDGMQGNTLNRMVAIGQPALPRLIDAYYGSLERLDQRHFRYLVLAVLFRLREPSTQEFLIQVLRRGDRKERRMAAEALWRFGDYRCVGALIDALDDDCLDVVNTVAAALRAITGFNYGIYRSISEAQRQKAIRDWRQWYAVTGSSFASGRASRY